MRSNTTSACTTNSINQLLIFFLLVWFNTSSILYHYLMPDGNGFSQFVTFPSPSSNKMRYLKVMVTLHFHSLAWTKQSTKVTIFVTIPLLYLYSFPFRFISWTKRPLRVLPVVALLVGYKGRECKSIISLLGERKKLGKVSSSWWTKKKRSKEGIGGKRK